MATVRYVTSRENDLYILRGANLYISGGAYNRSDQYPYPRCIPIILVGYIFGLQAYGLEEKGFGSLQAAGKLISGSFPSEKSICLL